MEQLTISKEEASLLYHCLISTQQFIRTMLPDKDNTIRIRLNDKQDVNILSLFMLQKKLEDFINKEERNNG